MYISSKSNDIIPYWLVNEQISVDLNELRVYMNDIGQDGFEIVKKLNEDRSIKSVRITGRIEDPFAFNILMSAIKGTQVKCLFFGSNFMCSDGAKRLAEGLKGSNITILIFGDNSLQNTELEYLPYILKDSCISELYVAVFENRHRFFNYLAEGLKNTSIIKLCVTYAGAKIDLLKHLDDVLPETNITELSINCHNEYRFKEFCVEDAEYLAKYLKYSCVTHLSVSFFEITDKVFEILSRALENSQIIEIDFTVVYPCQTSVELDLVTCTSKTKILASKIQKAFKKLVIENTENNNMEFVIPKEMENLDIGEYLYFIKTITYNPSVKGHILDLVESLGLISSKRIQKINEFIKAISEQFNAFFNNKLINLLDDFNFIDLVKQCEDMGLYDIVKNLLLHRHLYYVDDDQEILHPYIYKMLNKYGMILFMEQIEPKKKNVIKSYYESHPEIDGAQEIVDLLESHHL